MERVFVDVSGYSKSQKLTTRVIPELPLNDTSIKTSEAMIYFYLCFCVIVLFPAPDV